MACERISVDTARMRELPCIRGTRITVSAVLGQLAAAQTVDQVLDDYPPPTRDDVLAALEFAAPSTSERFLDFPDPG